MATTSSNLKQRRMPLSRNCETFHFLSPAIPHTIHIIRIQKLPCALFTTATIVPIRPAQTSDSALLRAPACLESPLPYPSSVPQDIRLHPGLQNSQECTTASRV